MIYYLLDQETQLVKIGRTDMDIRVRMYSLCSGNASNRVLLSVHNEDVEIERDIHQRFAASRVKGEWFSITPELIDWINQNDDAELILSESWVLKRCDIYVFRRYIKLAWLKSAASFTQREMTASERLFLEILLPNSPYSL